MKDKSKKSTYSTTFGIDPYFGVYPFYAWKPQKPQRCLQKKNAAKTASISGAP